MTELIYSDTLPGGKHWSMVMRRDHRLRLTDVDGGANVGMLFYNPQNLLERYNAPDTLKCQHTFKLTAGHCLYSDMGRIFCSIVADTVGWHDTVCGASHKAPVAARWGDASYQAPSQRLAAERPRQLPGRGRQVRPRPPRPRRQRQLVQQGRDRRGRQLRFRCGGRESRSPWSSCASRWTRSSFSTPARIRWTRARLSAQVRALRDRRGAPAPPRRRLPPVGRRERTRLREQSPVPCRLRLLLRGGAHDQGKHVAAAPPAYRKIVAGR